MYNMSSDIISNINIISLLLPLKSIRIHLPTEIVAVECDYVVVHH